MRCHHGGRRVKLHSKSSLFCDSSMIFDLKTARQTRFESINCLECSRPAYGDDQEEH